MKRHSSFNSLALGTVAGLCASAGLTARAGLADLTQPGAQETIHEAIFTQGSFTPASTGFSQPFMRLDQQGNDTYEAGYNTSLGTPLQVLGNSYHNDLLLSSLQVQTIGGNSYYEFFLNINQSQGQDANYLTLNQLQLFSSSTPAPAAGVTMHPNTGRAVGLGTPVWDLNSDSDPTGNAVKMDSGLSSGKGDGDLSVLIPTSYFSGPYVVVYSQFGKDPTADGWATNDGYEEWRALTITAPDPTDPGSSDPGSTDPSAPVPEPTTLAAGLLLTLPLGASTLRALRRRRTA